MPNVNQMLKSMARDQGVGLEVVQKDYALSYLLAGIAQTPGLGEKIVLKTWIFPLSNQASSRRGMSCSRQPWTAWPSGYRSVGRSRYRWNR
jgi:hypothetical protein